MPLEKQEKSLEKLFEVLSSQKSYSSKGLLFVSRE